MAKKPIEVPKTVEGNDVRVIVNIYSPDYEAKEFRMTIPNIRGIVSRSNRDPVEINKTILDGLRKKFGEKVG